MILVYNTGMPGRYHDTVYHFQNVTSPMPLGWTVSPSGPHDRGRAICGELIMDRWYGWSPIPPAELSEPIIAAGSFCVDCLAHSLTHRGLKAALITAARGGGE